MEGQPSRRPKLSLIVVVGLLLALLVVGDVASNQANDDDNSNSNYSKHPNVPEGQQGQQAAQTTSSACDLLFASSDNLANHCQCKDSIDPLNVAASGLSSASSLTPNDDDQHHAPDRQIESNRVEQLTCSHQNGTQIYHDLKWLQFVKTPNRLTGLQIDHLNIIANLSWPIQTSSTDMLKLHINMPTSAATVDKPQIDHISLHLIMVDVGRNIDHSNNSLQPEDYQPIMEQHMIDFAQSLTNGTHLQSLSVLVESNNNNHGHLLVNVTRLLDGLIALNRLELNLKGHRLLIETHSFGTPASACKLKWLNLASNNRIQFVYPQSDGDVFAPFCSSLEYLNLESNNLQSFHLYSLFSVAFKLDDGQYYGQPDLTYLNLANNELRSFRGDLFRSSTNVTVANQCQHRPGLPRFLLPALVQLDLSGNKLQDLSPEVGQLILCTMPNLNQLYLHHNRLAQLNLNPLLSHPLGWPGHLPLVEHITSMRSVVIHSKLDLLDISHNNLVSLVGWTMQDDHKQAQRGASQTRIKSINLAHNRLARLLDVVDLNAIDVDGFRQIMDNNGGIFRKQTVGSGGNSTPNYQLKVANLQAPTLCDFVARANSMGKSAQDQHEDDSLLNELIMNNNRLVTITSVDLSGKSCQDIQILRLDRNQIATIHPEALRDLGHLEHLDLSENNLRALSNATFSKNTRLKMLNLSKNKIKQLDRDIFWNLLELEELLLNENELQEMPHNVLMQNDQLTIVDLSNNKLTHLEAHLFAHLKQLKLLNLDGNKLREFSQQVFLMSRTPANPVQRATVIQAAKRRPKQRQLNENAKKVSKKSAKKRHQRDALDGGQDIPLEASNVLILSSNKLRTITLDECDISFVKQVRFLWLDNNDLRDVSGKLLKCFSEVQSLYLQSNGIETLDELAFSHLKQLETIDLSDNRIVRLREATLCFSPALRHVNLSGNKLISLNLMDVFASKAKLSAAQTDTELMQLELLNLSNNMNLKIYANDLVALAARSMLRHLNLANVTSIIGGGSSPTDGDQWAKFKDRIELDYLDLSSIERIDESVWAQLRWLATGKLNLSGVCATESARIRMQPQKLMSFVASKLEGLVELDLARNQLGSKHLMAMFANHSNDRVLQMSSLILHSNSIERWPFEANSSKSLAHLKQLDLSKNKLRYFVRREENSLANYELAALETLNMSSNSLISLMEYYAGDHKQAARFALLMPHLQHLDLSHNRLTWIPAGLFDQMHQLRSLLLSHNQLELIPPIKTSRGLLLDVSFNGRLKVDALEGSQNMEKPVDLPSGQASDLILFLGDEQLNCMSKDEFLHWYHANDTHLGPSTALQIIRDLSMARGDLEEDDYHRLDRDKCRLLLEQIDTLRLDSSFSQVHLNCSIASQRDKPTFVSVRRSGLETIQEPDWELATSNLIGLDVAFNKLQSIPSGLCLSSGNLKSLSLGHNQLFEYPASLSECQQLNYLDLSHNKITVMPSPEQIGDSLQVLILSFNRIKLLVAHQQADYYPLVSLLDVRFNQPAEVATTITTTAATTNNTSDVSSLPALQIPLANSGSLISSTHDKRSASGLDSTAISNKSDVTTTTTGNEDPVLSFIEQLRSCWLKVKELNLYEQLVGLVNVRSDSVLVNINGKYPIHTLAVIKVAIVFASVCIVVLLVAMFALLSVLSRNQSDRKSAKATRSGQVCGESNEENDFANNDTETSNGSTSMDQSSLSTSKETRGTNSSNNANNSVGSATNNSRTNSTMQTVIERTNSTNNTAHYHHHSHLPLLDAGQLLQQQVCSTPTSSSLAPSSVETGETMQAVDSIQSGASNSLNYSHLMFGGNPLSSVDQYDASYNDHSSQMATNKPVATVMRMVKSSSTGFDKNNNNNNLFHYGTLNSARYAGESATLKSRMRAIQEQHYNRHQIHPMEQVSSYYAGDVVVLGQQGSQTTLAPQHQSSVQQLADIDPTTLSLLSLNTVLSGSNFRGVDANDDNAFAKQQAPLLGPTSANLDNVTSQLDHQNNHLNLCQYHKLARSQTHGDSTGVQPPSMLSTSVILEQEEEQAYNAMGDGHHLLYMSEMPSPPPPPPPPPPPS